MTNSLPWKDPPIFKFGKPSISMGHLYHGHVSHNQRVSHIDDPENHSKEYSLIVTKIMMNCTYSNIKLVGGFNPSEKY